MMGGDYPVMTVNCGSCSRNRCFCDGYYGYHTYCRITGKQTDGSWLPGQPRPDEPCNDYNPSRRSIYACLIDWRRKRQEQKDRETKEEVK